MTPTLERLRSGAEALAGGLVAWVGIAQLSPALEPLQRAVYFALPALACALVSFPTFLPRWWARLAVASGLWGAAFYGSTRLYYLAGGAAAACAIAGFFAGVALTVCALRTAPRSISTHRVALVAAGALWVVGAALVGHGVELNLDHPLLQRRPGAPFLVAGMLLWHLPFGLLRAFRPLPADGD